jgi:class 3 adenylate cyclase
VQAATRYAKSGDVHIAYQVFGDGPRDLLVIPGAYSHLELAWEDPGYAYAMARLATFARVITFDKRGQGLSDRGVAMPTIEELGDDVLAVLDAAGSSRAAIFGQSEGGGPAMVFAAGHPARSLALILFGTAARMARSPESPWGRTPEESAQRLALLSDHWDQGFPVEWFAPSRVTDDGFREWWGKLSRASASVGDVIGLIRRFYGLDLVLVLPVIGIPTLVLHRAQDPIVPAAAGRDIAARIPGAQFCELRGSDHVTWSQNVDELIDAIEDFLTGSHHSLETNRILTTVMFTDVVDSTSRAAQLGDDRWREILTRYYALVERNIKHFRGRQVNRTGDGVFASFDGPARAIRCSLAIGDAAEPLGLKLRSGIHTGECETIGDDLSGIAVHIGARICALAGPRQVLVSNTVKELVTGSGFNFCDGGLHSLKGVPGEWRLFAAS